MKHHDRVMLQWVYGRELDTTAPPLITARPNDINSAI